MMIDAKVVEFAPMEGEVETVGDSRPSRVG